VTSPLLQLDRKKTESLWLGGTSGIGRAISLGLAESGADVGRFGAPPGDRVDATAAEIDARRSQTLRLTCDSRSKPLQRFSTNSVAPFRQDRHPRQQRGQITARLPADFS